MSKKYVWNPATCNGENGKTQNLSILYTFLLTVEVLLKALVFIVIW